MGVFDDNKEKKRMDKRCKGREKHSTGALLTAPRVEMVAAISGSESKGRNRRRRMV